MVAEIVALLVAIVHSPLGVLISFATDCAAVFYGFQNLVKATRYTCMHAGLWRQIADACEGRNIAVRKVKAHRSEAEARIENDIDDFVGNDVADAHAKHIAREASFRELEVEK